MESESRSGQITDSMRGSGKTIFKMGKEDSSTLTEMSMTVSGKTESTTDAVL